MTIHEAERTGVESFQAGRLRAPSLNSDFIQAACQSPTSTLDLLDAYSHGWIIASLADGMTDEELPSKKELKRIMS